MKEVQYDKGKYQIRGSTQLKNLVKKYKEFSGITDTCGKNGGMKGVSNWLKEKYPVIWFTKFAGVHR
ncbi:TPA: hypothetical protein ACR3Z0_003058 [Bacillus thuringiensis]|uniref:hypothetical protein n=1 Tax=Bacillus cereus group TaxID=86661 RepID=UPI0003ADF901|nr:MULTISPECIES: hypothetical protein [Bacillus cereus group]ETE91943.1 hypothetical protein C621_0216465 [Bacillus thuringiensis serovar aizawai str. Leapi01]ETE96171.1 hypothetical protein C623_0220590 [Bacillus thuringiensis serovar aizawai str. Hu4-2]KAB1378837.1 hypothetical protein FPG93_16290 [Bacillus thuringiensis]MCC3874240.1 hypothetical protein [Bacillus thuringiensis]MCC3879896.1 hypothetical protein [Bacillus thuringiensis]